MQQASIKKRQRASRACDFCHMRGLRCRWKTPGSSQSTLNDSRQAGSSGCLTCEDYGAECTMKRPVQKRGRKSTAPNPRTTENVHTSEDFDLQMPSPSTWLYGALSSWEEINFRSIDIVKRLVRIYHDTMYPNFPFLPEKDLLSRWDESIPDPDSPSYMLLMALCAVSSQTASLNAVFDNSLLQGVVIPDSENYFYEATSKIPFRIVQCTDLDYLRSFGLLAVYSIQRGNHSDLHRYLALYHALVAQHGFHEESRWPADLSISDIDDRRRLFWCMYRLEIHSACILGHVVRMPESQVTVFYPRITPSTEADAQAWISGWDYITDLFRLLEYAIFCLRACKSRKAVLAPFCDRPSPATLLDALARLKAGKPRILLGLAQDQNDFQSNRCRYLAVQIMCTETLVNIMALLYCQAPADEMMNLVEEFLKEVTKVSLILFKVSGSPLVHQLVGVGHMLHNASQQDNGRFLGQAKRLIMNLSNLVKSLKDHIPSAADSGDRLWKLAEGTS
ncbi:hypothetical protein JX265_012628 [Neoarthrinium moseri]|uniref:Xylanolytic transcriptional activator regulatory domain-containing protein n=1 Tax=Neoarthrinium moseri TaxID=1658444 RepID=A0A9P9WAK5_9PEZI|nr:uncharacterized protein JN550_010931 [Neoarthrinium moseri]KAI1842635.1 hypothetical protein JX266_011248 [Neoarthrinium moseri]KAI1853943.1 hypothetical protein JX265_012628 [Neoarthrinium moseri]KAI1861401.1 hypothetical protein JN550_010931 [Neoarthrinium moseri]